MDHDAAKFHFTSATTSRRWEVSFSTFLAVSQEVLRKGQRVRTFPRGIHPSMLCISEILHLRKWFAPMGLLEPETVRRLSTRLKGLFKQGQFQVTYVRSE